MNTNEDKMLIEVETEVNGGASDAITEEKNGIANMEHV